MQFVHKQCGERDLPYGCLGAGFGEDGCERSGKYFVEAPEGSGVYSDLFRSRGKVEGRQGSRMMVKQQVTKSEMAVKKESKIRTKLIYIIFHRHTASTTPSLSSYL